MKIYTLFALIGISLFTAGQSHAELPADAQQAVKKGIIAAQEQDDQLAIRYFQDARKIAPDASEIYFDLGLAESKIPGRELRAIAWFGAYLAAVPNAPNAAAVKDQIDALDIKSQSNISHLIQSVQDAAINIPITQDAWPIPGTYHHDDALEGVADLWAASGDFTAARNAIALMPAINDPLGVKEQAEGNVEKSQENSVEDEARAGNISGALRDAKLLPAKFLDEVNYVIAIAQGRAGDIAEAYQSADSIKDKDYKNDAFGGIAEAQAKAGDVISGLKTIDLHPQLASRSGILNDIVKDQVKAGDITGALKTAGLDQDCANCGISSRDDSYNTIAQAQIEANDIMGAQKSVEFISSVVSKNVDLRDIAKAQLKAGDMTGAQKTVDSIHADSIKDEDYAGDYKCDAQVAIAEAQIKAGDIAGAQKTLEAAQKTVDLLTTVYKKDSHEVSIANVKAEAHDIGGAFKTSHLIQDPSYKSNVFEDIAEVQARSGDMVNAQKTADLLKNGQDVNGRMLALPSIVKGQAEAGNIAGAFKTFDSIQDASAKNYALGYIADAQTKAGDFSGALKAANMIQEALTKCYAQEAIAEAQVKTGDIAGGKATMVLALNTADLLEKANWKAQAQAYIAKDQAKAGDIPGAQRTADLIQDTYYKSSALKDIADAQGKAASTVIQYTIADIPVSDWITKLDDSSKTSSCPLNSAVFLDLASALKSLPPSDNTQTVYLALRDIVGKVVYAQNVIDLMLKQQANQQVKL